MVTDSFPTLIGAPLAQVAWVVRDIQAAEKFFQETLGVGRFWKMENLRAQEMDGTYYGQPGDWEYHLYLAYLGEMQIELIQPISGRSIFHDFLDRHGPGVQHVAYLIPELDYDQAAAELSGRGYPLIQRLRFIPATVGFFDTYAEIGVATEIIGLTDAGRHLLEQIKHGDF